MHIMLRTELLPVKVIQGHWSCTNRKRVYIFLLVVNGNLDHILHRFRDTAAYRSKINFLPYPIVPFRLKFGVFLWSRSVMLGSTERRMVTANHPWNYFRRIPTRVITIHQRHRQTDGRTDIQVMIQLIMAIPRYATLRAVNRVSIETQN